MTRPGPSLFNTPDGHYAMTEDIQGLIPWIRESWANAARLWCAFSNVTWRKGEIEFSVTFRGAGAYVGEIYMGTERYMRDSMNYMEFYCSGHDGVVDPKIFEYLTALGWKPYGYSPKGPYIISSTSANVSPTEVEITEPVTQEIEQANNPHNVSPEGA